MTVLYINKNYIFGALIWIIAVAILYYNIPFGSEILWINQHNQPVFDFSFKYITILGESLWVLVLISCLYSYKNALISLSVYLSTTIVVQSIKHLVYAPRPFEYFSQKGITLQLVEGIKIHHFNSFPSGHTTSAFAIGILLSYFYGRKIYSQYLFLALSILTGVSRMYLCQHFLKDILAGSIIGTFVSVLTIYWIEKKAYFTKEKYQKGLLKK